MSLLYADENSKKNSGVGLTLCRVKVTPSEDIFYRALTGHRDRSRDRRTRLDALSIHATAAGRLTHPSEFPGRTHV